VEASARDYSGEARAAVTAAVERLVDYQDADYAKEFLARLSRFKDIEQQHGDGSGRLVAELARQLALAMSYEDTIRVAELKIRPSRFARVRKEVQVAPDQILEIAEFFHPRVQEIADTLPAAAGDWLLRTRWARGLLDRALRKGKIVKTTSLSGFLLLYALSRLKPLRRRSLRFAREQGEISAWLDHVAETATADYALALELARLRGLVKGYGETLERGRAKSDKLMALLPRLRAQVNQGAGAGAALGALIKAALADEEGRALDKAITEFNRETDAMSYHLDAFVSDCRAILKRDPGPGGREEVRTRLERLLANKEFVEEYCGDNVPRGLKLLYEDPELGFQVLAHINDKARVSPPHDHGASWAIYGQATHYTEMTEWEREDNGGDPGKAKLKPVKKYRLVPGHAGIYQDGKIHSIDYPDHARFVRVTGTNLDRIPRVSFDLATGKVNQMAPQQAT
jgi:predicted metal-dependent enzyme (double-stranded beta helix superfamily)